MLVNSVGGILLLLVLIRRGAVAGVAALFFLVPPVSAAMAYALFGEALAPIQIGGMALARLGVAHRQPRLSRPACRRSTFSSRNISIKFIIPRIA